MRMQAGLSRLQRHRIPLQGPGRRRLGQRYSSRMSTSIRLRGDRNSSRSRRRLARVPPSSGGSGCPVRIELVKGAQLGHDVGGVEAVEQHSLHRVTAGLAVVDQLGDKGDRAHLTHQRGIYNPLVLEQSVQDTPGEGRVPSQLARARLTDLISTIGAGIQSGLVCRPIVTLPSILAAPRRGASALEVAPVVHEKMFRAVLTGGNAD